MVHGNMEDIFTNNSSNENESGSSSMNTTVLIEKEARLVLI